MRRCLFAVAVFALLVTVSRRSHAHAPPFWWMADMSDTGRAGVELTLGNPTLFPLTDTVTVAASVFGEFAVNPFLALRARMPLTFVFFDDPLLGEDSEAALGNLSLGMQAHARSRAGGGAVTIFGGGFDLYLPTASDSAGGIAAAAATLQLTLPDPGRWLVDTTTARFRGDARVEAGFFFFQGEVAVDAQFREGDDELDLVLGLGPGFVVSPRLAFLVELAVAELTDEELFTIDLGLRYHDSRVMAGFRFYVPLSDPLRDQDVFGAGIDVGARF
jgi:hypothetical protein